jgi:anti-anti-sigma factor
MGATPEHATLARIEQTLAEQVSVVTVAGELDISNVAKFRDAVYALPNEGLGVVVDLTHTRFMDSTTVSVLFDLHANLARRRQSLRVVCPPGSTPRRLLEITCFPSDTLAERDAPAAVAAIRAALSPDQ